MMMNIFEVVTLGQKYMKLWPEKSELSVYFADYRVIQVSRFVYRYFPSLAILSVIGQLYFGSIAILPQALTYGIFILSMPLQALLMLGLKADKYLPPSLSSWYKEGVAKINEQGGDIKLSVNRPRYFDLAQLLNISYKNYSHQ
tara:strand:+ start:345 stop:773 length:429 start_codon:yes stop_codon:yes gene_type:complete